MNMMFLHSSQEPGYSQILTVQWIFLWKSKAEQHQESKYGPH